MRRALTPFSLPALAAALCLTMPAARAQFWTGGGATDNWSDTGNWKLGVPPQPASPVLFQASPRTRSVQDLGNPFTVAGLLFESSPGGIRIEGNPIHFVSDNTEIFDNSTTLFEGPVVAAPVRFSGPVAWVGDVAGGYHDPGVTLLEVSGPGSLVVNTRGRARVGHATYTGTTTIRQGIFEVGGNYGSGFTHIEGLTENQGDYLVRPDPGASAVLSGSGTIGLAPGGKITVEGGGMVSPDMMTIGEPASTRITVLGDVRFGDGGVYQSTPDLLDVRGLLDLTGVNDVLRFSSHRPEPHSITVARYQSRLGEFDRIESLGTFPLEGPIIVSYTSAPGAGPGEVVVTVLPEPATTAGATTALAVAALRRRRRD